MRDQNPRGQRSRWEIATDRHEESGKTRPARVGRDEKRFVHRQAGGDRHVVIDTQKASSSSVLDAPPSPKTLDIDAFRESRDGTCSM
jgi:hypothetical protein